MFCLVFFASLISFFIILFCYLFLIFFACVRACAACCPITVDQPPDTQPCKFSDFCSWDGGVNKGLMKLIFFLIIIIITILFSHLF